jgi:hypothetical protein
LPATGYFVSGRKQLIQKESVMAVDKIEILQDGTFRIEGKLDEPERSSSGKTFIVLSTHGNQAVKGGDGKKYMVGLNVFTKAPEAQA